MVPSLGEKRQHHTNLGEGEVEVVFLFWHQLAVPLDHDVGQRAARFVVLRAQRINVLE